MIKITKIIPGGQALGTNEDGRKIFFWNALPDECVEEYTITKNKSHYLEAVASRITNPSKYRELPKDECYLSTSPWQIINWDYENQLKSDLVVEIFHQHQIDITPPKVFTDNHPYYYRNKMEYALYWDNNEAIIKPAFRARGTHKKIPIINSSLERPEIFSEAKRIINKLNANGEQARDYQSLLIRCNQNGEVSGGLYKNHQPHPKFHNLQDKILGYDYSYSPNGFFQINLPVYELALKEIAKYINTDKVLDLYAGVGTIGLSVAHSHNLTLVEVDKPAFLELEKNCAEVSFGGSLWRRATTKGQTPVTTGCLSDAPKRNLRAVFSKSEHATDYITSNQTVILDPPRAGCHQELIKKLNQIKPKTIIYLSCNPATQARDIKLLLDNYSITDIKTFNFFPRTPHIENLVILNI